MGLRLRSRDSSVDELGIACAITCHRVVSNRERGERDRERERDRQKERERGRQTDRKREGERARDRQKERERDRVVMSVMNDNPTPPQKNTSCIDHQASGPPHLDEANGADGRNAVVVQHELLHTPAVGKHLRNVNHPAVCSPQRERERERERERCVRVQKCWEQPRRKMVRTYPSHRDRGRGRQTDGSRPHTTARVCAAPSSRLHRRSRHSIACALSGSATQRPPAAGMLFDLKLMFSSVTHDAHPDATCDSTVVSCSPQRCMMSVCSFERGSACSSCCAMRRVKRTPERLR